jgi:hypothetical protein
MAMAQGQFTKEEATETITSFDEIFGSMSRKKKMEFIGHANDIFLFLEAAKRAAPAESDLQVSAAG